MKKLFLSLILAAMLAFNADAATVSKDFTAVGNGTSFSVKVGDSFSYNVSGLFVGTVVLQKSETGGATWETVTTLTSPGYGEVLAESRGGNQVAYRFICSAFTSGTISTTMTDEDVKTVQEFKNSRGETVAKINEKGLTVKNLTVLGSTYGVTGMVSEMFVNNNALLDNGNVTGVRKNIIQSSPDGVYQYMIYWDNEQYLQTCQRTIATQKYFTCYQQTGIQQITDLDSHRQPSLGVDPNGYIHINYHNWADALNYRVSTNPNDISTFGSEITMGGTAETQVTYLIFFNDHTNGGKLYATYRDGTSGNGDQYVKVYDHTTTTWSTLPGTSSGKLTNGKATLDSAYIYGPPKFDDNGDAHFAFTWWDSNISAVDAHDVFYVKWDHASQTFKKSTGAAQTVPITQANWDRAAVVAKSTGVATNGCGLDIDSNGHPYIAFTKNDANGFRQVYIAYSNGSAWTVKQLTYSDKKTIGFITQIFADRDAGKFYIVETDENEASQDMVIETEDNFATWDSYKISNRPGPRYPQYDYNRWQLHKILDMSVIYSQPFQETITVRSWQPGFKTSSLYREDNEDFTIAKNVIMKNPAPKFMNATTFNFEDGILTVGAGGMQFGVLYAGDTSDDRVELPADVVHDPMTIVAKIKTTDLSVAQTIIAKQGGSNDRGWRFGIATTGHLLFSSSADGITANTRTATSLPLSINTIYDVGVVYNGSSATFYVDGTAATDDAATVSANTTSSSTDCLIGAYTSGGTSFLNELEGYTYDMQVYWSALSAGNMSTIHSNNLPLSSVKYWWPHAEGSGSFLGENIEGFEGVLRGGSVWSGSTSTTGLNGEGDVYIKDDLEVVGSMIKAAPLTQTIAAGNTVTADGCGGLKNISSAGAVTTSTTNTFTAPATTNTGCTMVVCNVGAENITLDNNALFKSAGGADVVVTPDDCLAVNSDGSVWRQTSALLAN